MDPKMPKLPAYVFRRQNGSYRYKRNVPKKLRPLIGKDTLYRQLGESYSEAMTALPKVHLEIEQLFAAEETMPANELAPTCSESFSENKPKRHKKIPQSYGHKDSSNSRR